MATPTSTPTSIDAVTGALIDNAESAGNFFPYLSNATPSELPGLRTVVKTYKQSKAMKASGTVAAPNVYVRIPTAHITVQTVTDSIAELAPYIVSYLQGLEDTTIQNYHAKGGLHVFISTLTLAKVLADLEDSGTSGLNGEMITEWFTESVAPNLVVLLGSKLGQSDFELLTDDEQSKIKQVISSYLDSFISLASGKTILSEVARIKLAKCMQLTDSDTTTLGTKFSARFAKMAEKEQEAAAALGDLDL